MQYPPYRACLRLALDSASAISGAEATLGAVWRGTNLLRSLFGFVQTDKETKGRQLTYKSISVLLQSLEQEGKIVRFVPNTRGASQRRLYIIASAEIERNDSNSAINILVGRGYITASLTRWSSGGLIHADDKGKPRFLKELDPPPNDIWEIRVTDPRPQARLLGAFAEKDTLVLFKFCTRNFLGNRGSAGWNSAMAFCDTSWKGLFGSAPRLHAKSIDDYVSENYDYFKLKR